MQRLSGNILTPDGWVHGDIQFDSQIRHIKGKPLAETDLPDAPIVLPGFIDLHVHGGAGADSMQGEVAIKQMATLHAKHGTTSLLATSVTAPIADIAHFLRGVAKLTHVIDAEKPHARVLGAHLEGPFINPNKLGAQPDAAITPNTPHLEAVKTWLDIAPVKVMTLAPEIDNADALIKLLQAHHCRVQLGHSLCDYARAAHAIHHGCGVTHLFNAMSGFAHRDNGLAGAAMAHSDYAEIIPDLCHVEAGAIHAARRAIPYLYGVTDATAGAGMPDGEYELGSHTVTKASNAMRLADGTLAGSALTMDVALKNLVNIGLTIAEASQRLSTYPANWLGEKQLGRLQVNSPADVLVLNAELTLTRTYIGGLLVNVNPV